MAESDLESEPLTDLEETFDRASKYLQTLVSELDSGQLLGFYGLYKQATVGPCDIPKPNWYQIQAKHKWEAWKNLGDMSREIAMTNYIHGIEKINPSWDEEEAKAGSQKWIVFSKLSYGSAELNDEDKTFLDWIKEGNETKVREFLSSEPALVNKPDEEGMHPIHWAADRGYLGILDYLIKSGANVNSRDQYGQTALHYVVSCDHVDAVKYLLSIGAQSNITDNDGMTPKEIANEQIAALF
ncbi:PREDICTED: acyl-CoA-binding domain-containing protein 6-like [Cyphomyrmex costatus]|uniref:acyl-CoA-binding domain-containing protein 6-like n=1 Tax=Cyphomyrmex costatus TaxID=456900 RepID=UPI0008522187|nr:PREDICTED: acyl-CoA-binding domain-containing protein 6-like [Cyphomyrmex costatus]